MKMFKKAKRKLSARDLLLVPNPQYITKYKAGDILLDVSYPNDMEHIFIMGDSLDDHGRVVYHVTILEDGHDDTYDAQEWDSYERIILLD
jgi:hypothetical protein